MHIMGNYERNSFGPIKPSKLSYLNVPGERPLLHYTIPQLIDMAVEKYGDAPALIVSDLDISRTFRQLKEEVQN